MQAVFFLIIFLAGSLSAYERTIAIITDRGWLGEITFSLRMQKACQNLNWEADLISSGDTYTLTKEYDFMLNLVPVSHAVFPCNSYLAVFHPYHHYFDGAGFLKEGYKHYSGYLLSYSIEGTVCDFTDQYQFPSLTWYPTTQRQEYSRVNPQYLFYTCCQWGNRRNDEKYQEMLSLLDQKAYTYLYGAPYFKELYPNTYQNEIPFDSESVIQTIREAGIILVLHSAEHLECGIPSGRIFEAAAASAVIISDKNAFVVEHFGDAVLYIDVDVDGRMLYKQIDQHMRWIRKNKSQALEMAKKAHRIYKKKFLLENQLRRLDAFNQELLNRQAVLQLAP